MRPLAFAAMIAAILASPAAGDDSIPIETVKQIKAATVYVKVRAGGTHLGTGSGFLIKVEGETGYIVTNSHVAAPQNKGVGGSISLSVVFNSGTKSERTSPAELVASDPVRDLAVLKISGMKDLPRPIDLAREAELVETLPVTSFGFPLGQSLSGGKENPEITIVRGSISSVRTDAREVVESVQIDGGILPGNSGGPAVDNKGSLVGIVVAYLPGTSIGWAIPARHLAEMLGGRLRGDFDVKTTSVLHGNADIEAVAHVVDPLGKLKSASIHVVKADSIVGSLKPNSQGEWEKLPGARKVDLSVKGGLATGTFPLKSSMADSVSYYFQASYVSGDGKVHYTEPGSYAINLKTAPSVAKGPPKKEVLTAEGNSSPRSPSTPGAGEAQRRMETLRMETRQRMEELKAQAKARKRR